MVEFTTRVFKSGNSLAIRLPKALGFRVGEDVKFAPHRDGSFSVWRESDAAKVLDSLYGAFSPGFMAGGRGDIEQEDRDWSRSGRDRAA